MKQNLRVLLQHPFSFKGGKMNKGLFYLLMGLTGGNTLSSESAMTQSAELQNSQAISVFYDDIAIGKKDNIPVYTSNNLNSKVLDYLNVGESVQLGNEMDGFVEIESGDVTGWIKSDELVYGCDIPETAADLGVKSHLVAKYNSAQIYKDADLLSEKVRNTFKYETYTDFSEQGNFYKIEFNNQEGYVYADSVTLEFEFKSMTDSADAEAADEDCIYYLDNNSSYLTADWNVDYNLYSDSVNTFNGNTDISEDYQIPTSTSDSAVANQLVKKALTYVGNRYVWGGNSLDYGVDCSGFVQQLYKLYGYNLPRTSSSQAKMGVEVSANNLQLGDLVFYSKKGVVNHVALYIGNGLIVHASNSAPYPKGGVKISKVFYREPTTIRRVIR